VPWQGIRAGSFSTETADPVRWVRLTAPKSMALACRLEEPSTASEAVIR
jgi:hypothetical protein